MTEPIEMEVVPASARCTCWDEPGTTNCQVCSNLTRPAKAAVPDMEKLKTFARFLRTMEIPLLSDTNTTAQLKIRVSEVADWCEGKAQSE